MSEAKDISGSGLCRDVARVVLSRRQIARGVSQLARRVSECCGQGEITLVTVLTGSFVFLSDLIRRLAMPARVEMVCVESYPGDACRTRGPRFVLPLRADLRGRNVLIVDDILDSGRTLSALLEAVRGTGPAGVRSCVLLRKDRPDLPRRTEADFVGFDIPDCFVVGYGLDFDGLYRNLPDVCVLKRHAPAQARPQGLAVPSAAQAVDRESSGRCGSATI